MMKLTLRSLYSFETIFVSFLLSYQFKNALLFQSWPDLTLLLFGGTLLAFFVARVLDKRKTASLAIKPLSSPFFSFETILILLFLCLAWTSRSWSLTPDIRIPKLLHLTLYTIPAYLFAEHFIAPSRIRLERLYCLFAAISLFVTVAVFQVLFLETNPDLNNILGNNYLIAGQTLGLGAIILFAYSLHNQTGFSLLSPPLLLTIILFATLLILPGRGPILSAFTALLFLSIFASLNKEKRRASALSFLFILMAAFGIYLLYAFTKTGPLDTSLTRSQDFLLPVIQDRSLLDRFDYYHSAITLFLQNPFFGVGFGDWPAASGIDSPFAPHPHNLFLEIASELGLAGIVLTSILGALLFENVRKAFHRFSKDLHLMLILGLFIFAFMNALKSGDLNDNIMLWFCMGLLASSTKQKTTQL